MPTNAYKTTLLGTRSVAVNTKAIRLEKPEGFRFEPGQHIGVKILNPPAQDEKGNVRTLSIASAPEEQDLLLATRMSDSAFKQSIEQIQEGAAFEIDGPYGSMTLDKNDAPAVCLAGGIGITPFLSMMRHIDIIESNTQLHLLHSNRRPKDAPFLDEIEELASGSDQLSHTPTMTRRSEVEDDWSGSTGYITKDMMVDEVETLDKSMFYIAGPDSFAKSMEKHLKMLNIPKQHVRAEIFAGY